MFFFELEEEFVLKTTSEDKKPIEIKGKYFFVILNKQYFRKKNTPIQQTPEKQRSFDPELVSNENKLYSSERITLNKSTTPQKASEEKKQLNITTNPTHLSRALSPGSGSHLNNSITPGSGSIINNSINSAGKLKTQNSQARVNTGTPKKKMKASPIILDTIVKNEDSRYLFTLIENPD